MSRPFKNWALWRKNPLGPPKKMHLARDNWFFFLVLLILIAAVALYGGPYFLKILKPTESGISRPIPSSEKSKLPSDTNTISTAVEPEENFDGPVVNYTGNGFEPYRLKLRADYKFGCLLKIKNKSGKNLTLRLGPYEKSILVNYGQKYLPIPPGQYLLKKPRFFFKKKKYFYLLQSESKFKLVLT